ncbi:MAG: glycoside hydrolase family 2 TIM barrel-domain containing protein [Niabella sp.]
MKQFLLCGFLFFVIQVAAQQDISLAGSWKVRLDKEDRGVKEQWFLKDEGQTIKLPGTLDDAGIGERLSFDTTHINKDVLIKLTRKHAYVGAAWYTRKITIPSGWKQKDIRLYLERALWKTRVWIDGKEVGAEESLSTPHIFNITGYATPGTHVLTIRIDNRKQHEISYKDMGHAYTDGTQIIWNGLVGLLELQARERVRVGSLQVFPDVEQRSADLKVDIKNDLPASQKAVLTARVYQKGGRLVAAQSKTIVINKGTSVQQIKLSLGSNASLWDEFNPELYTAVVSVQLPGKRTADRVSSNFGLRSISKQQQSLFINGRPVFLRGTLECNIFPLTGHPPMTHEGWLKVFQTAKNYGLNHLRFHSWCPPKAAFEVADSMGFYLQVELPFWSLEIGKDTGTLRFLENEAQRMIREYGNHPSFCLWSLGNELQGDFSWLSGMVQKLRDQDKRRLYTTTTFTFQKDHGRWPEPEDDFFVTQYTKNGWVRGQGVFNSHAPDFEKDYAAAVKDLPVPLITHEIGQYSVYPRLGEIEKYTGVLDPLNFKTIRNDLRKKQMLHLSDSFTLASGIFAAGLYKEEMERALKTKGISGFQLLDLHDFPGQGTALVGILDAFWDSKQLVIPEQHRMYSSEVVPLIRYPKAVYTNGETFNATAEIANYSAGPLKDPVMQCTIKAATGKVVYSKDWVAGTIGIGGGNVAGNVSLPLNTLKEATQLTVELSIKGTAYKNQWSIWVYPQAVNLRTTDVYFTRSVDEALKMLEEGKKVLLNPDTSAIKGVQGRFASVFWSPVHFPDQPGTMGILCNPQHPALQQFPTAFHSDWQWWDLITSSKTMVIDSLPAMTPVVRVIDNFFKNRKMANILEARLGKGHLILTSVNIADKLDQRPAARQLRYSLQQYMQSEQFKPTTVITREMLQTLLK